MRSKSCFIAVQGHQIEVKRLAGAGPHKPSIVFLHEGLGSISTWRDFPERIVARTGCTGVVYSRYGHGNSDVLEGHRSVEYMHQDARQVLPELLDKLGLKDFILLGHSDGASIALIYQGSVSRDANREGDLTRGALKSTKPGPRAHALILLAPHVFVEDLTVESVRKTKISFETTGLVEKLKRHHKNSEATFLAWSRIWLDPEFRKWNIEEFLSPIACPVLAIQGLQDQYGTLKQLDAIEEHVHGPFRRAEVQNCGHSLHRDEPDQLIELIGDFVERF